MTNQESDDDPVIEDVDYTGKKDTPEIIETSNKDDGFGDFGDFNGDNNAAENDDDKEDDNQDDGFGDFGDFEDAGDQDDNQEDPAEPPAEPEKPKIVLNEKSLLSGFMSDLGISLAPKLGINLNANQASKEEDGVQNDLQDTNDQDQSNVQAVQFDGQAGDLSVTEQKQLL
jgi:hypothetical protein